MSIVKKPWSEMTDDQKLGEVMNLEQALRDHTEFSNVLEDKMEQLAKFVQMYKDGNIEIRDFIEEIVALGEWWTKLESDMEGGKD